MKNKIVRKKGLKTIVLNLHNIGCSQRCVFCQVHKFIDKNEADLIAREQLSDLDSFCHKNGEPDLIILSGNDPGEYSNLADFLKEIKKITQAKVFIQSNCLAFSDIVFTKKVLLAGNVESIQVPLYGYKAQIHDTITGEKGSFKKIIKALDNLKKLGFKRIKIHTLFLKQNEDFLSELFRFLLTLDLPIDASLVCLPSCKGIYSQKTLKNVPNIEKIRSFFKREAEMIGDFNDRLFFYDLPLCLAVGAKNLSFFDSGASGGYKHFSKDKIDISKCGKGTVASYRILKKMPTCKKCSLFNRCQGITKPYIDLNLFKPEVHA
ncbi:MAG TPA: radical SAM protein [Candidatus Portnoybacteria bacterium]|nr:radical SAM protein [Candidatus Portnoybacteria bacterium]